jgi:hypothetical protein
VVIKVCRTNIEDNVPTQDEENNKRVEKIAE